MSSATTLRDTLTRRFPLLRRLGPTCYVVGGAVRDLLLGKDAHDVDVTCNDARAAAASLRRNVIQLGRGELSAYRIVVGDDIYDFAETLDHDITRDLGRRDFTMNAIAVEIATGAVLDLFDGEADARAGRVRMIATKNFDDDPLRMLKGVRMCVVYGFTFDAETLRAIQERAATIENVSVERVTAEFALILGANQFRRALALLRETGLAPYVLDAADTFEPHEDAVSLAGSFALTVQNPKAFAERWRWSDSLTRDVQSLQRLITKHDRVALFDAGEAVARQLPAVLRARGENDALDWPDFSTTALLTGEEIATAAALPPGPALGKRKRALLEAQVRGEVRTREDAEAFVKSGR